MPEKRTRSATFYGVLYGSTFQPDTLDLGGIPCRRPVIELTTDPNHHLDGNRVGGGFLCHYLVTIDVAGGAMYLKPAPPPAQATTIPSR